MAVNVVQGRPMLVTGSAKQDAAAGLDLNVAPGVLPRKKAREARGYLFPFR